jgi:hypothetical protein
MAATFYLVNPVSNSARPSDTSAIYLSLESLPSWENVTHCSPARLSDSPAWRPTCSKYLWSFQNFRAPCRSANVMVRELWMFHR